MSHDTRQLIKRHREAQGLSMAQAGAAMKPRRSRQQWHQWEAGERGMSIRTLKAIAEALGVSPSTIMGGK